MLILHDFTLEIIIFNVYQKISNVKLDKYINIILNQMKFFNKNLQKRSLKSLSWGGRDRTFVWRLQRPLPYRLATPQNARIKNLESRILVSIHNSQFLSRDSCFTDDSSAEHAQGLADEGVFLSDRSFIFSIFEDNDQLHFGS